jgi:hypothetical protein
MAHLAMVNSLPAAPTGTNATDPALLTAINALCASMSAQQEQLAKMQAAQLAQSIKSVAKLPVLKDPGLKAAAGCAVESIKLNVDEGECGSMHSNRSCLHSCQPRRPSTVGSQRLAYRGCCAMFCYS